jgi:phospholipase/carboxylesterase
MREANLPEERRMAWVSGSSSFARQVPFELWKGAAGRPLIVALHGMGESEDVMVRRMEPLAERGFSLLVPRAPFPTEIRRGERIRIGHAWYQYDGDENRFVASMNVAAEYLFPLVDLAAAGGASHPPRASGVVVVGFSQGAYLGYYMALRFPERFSGVCGIGGRAKEEVLTEHLAAARHVRVLHLHGANDPAVSADACRESIEALAAAGLDATFRTMDAGHTVTPDMIDALGAFAEGSRP